MDLWQAVLNLTRYTPSHSPPFSTLRITFIHGRYHMLSLCITLRLTRLRLDFGSEGWGFKSLRGAPLYHPLKPQDGIIEVSVAYN